MIYNQWAINQIVCIIRSFQALLITYLPHVMNAEYADLIVFFHFDLHSFPLRPNEES